MADYKFTTSTEGSIDFSVDGNTSGLPKGILGASFTGTSQYLKILNTAGYEQSDTIYTINLGVDTVDVDGVTVFADAQALYDALKPLFFLANSSGGGIPNPEPTGEGELISIDGAVQWDTRPYTVDDSTNVSRFKDDLYIAGELFAQQTSIFIGGGVKLGASNYVPLLNRFDSTDQYVFPLASQGTGITKLPRYTDSYSFWDKNSPTGQFQPSQTTTIDSYINPNYDPNDPRNPTKGYQYTFPIIVQASQDLRVINWYLRSATGFDNYHVKMYEGIVNAPSVGQLPLWQSHSDKQILNGDCFSSAPSVNADIQFPLNNTYYQTDQQLYTFIGYAESPFQFEAGTLNIPPNPPIDYPYVIADGYFLYNKLVYNPPVEVGSTENIEGFQQMNDGTVWGILKGISQTDVNFTDVLIGQNGMNVVGQEAALRYAIYDSVTLNLLTQGSTTIDTTTPDKSFIRINHDDVLKVDEIVGAYVCLCANDFTQGGGFTLGRTRSQNINESEILFNADLPSGVFPASFNGLANIRSTANSINSFTSLSTDSIESTLVPFATGL